MGSAVEKAIFVKDQILLFFRKGFQNLLDFQPDGFIDCEGDLAGIRYGGFWAKNIG